MQVRNYKWLFLFSLLLIFFSCKQEQTASPLVVKTGLDQVKENTHLFSGKRIGIITNHTAVNEQGEHITHVFQEMENVKVAALFGPEHGVYGNAAAGQKIESDNSEKIPIYSLYGKTKKPTKEMLQDIHFLVFDIQDIGTRYYTYVWTLSHVMDAAAENNIPLIVLDRPNPINGKIVEGNIADTSSFVGRFPIPVRHGMTIGELAKMFKGENWVSANLDLTVIPLKNWVREKWFDQTGLVFLAPSPNMSNLTTAAIYPGMCLLEGTNLSEGRGTEMPFEIFGAPWIESKKLRMHLLEYNLDGISFSDTVFTPQVIPGKAVYPKFENELCKGLKIIVDNRENFASYQSGVMLIHALYNLYPDHIQFKQKHFDRLAGSSNIRKAILNGSSIQDLKTLLSNGLDSFKQKRKKYLIY